jgi:hypothetical protein
MTIVYIQNTHYRMLQEQKIQKTGNGRKQSTQAQLEGQRGRFEEPNSQEGMTLAW